MLVGLYSKETVALIRGAKYVTECPRIGHILGNERDLMYRMMVKAILRIKINLKHSLNVRENAAVLPQFVRHGDEDRPRQCKSLFVACVPQPL